MEVQMPLLRFELQNGAGRTIDQIRDGGLLHELIPVVSDERFTCWRFVDPYGETVFNHLQLPIFRREIDLLRPTNGTRQEVEHILDLVDDLAAVRAGDIHRYLKIVGD
jgi:hypothetical protein